MSWLENDAFEQMYERAGFMATDDGAMVMLAGSTLGGGQHSRFMALSAQPPCMHAGGFRTAVCS